LSFPALRWIAEWENYGSATSVSKFWLASKNKDPERNQDLIKNILELLHLPSPYSMLGGPPATSPTQIGGVQTSSATIDSQLDTVPTPLFTTIRDILLRSPGAQTSGRQADSVGLFFYRLPEISLIPDGPGCVHIHMLSEDGFANRGEKRIKEILMFAQQVSELRRKEGTQTPRHLTLGCSDFEDLEVWAEVVSGYIGSDISI
jgi:hypothetical protein